MCAKDCNGNGRHETIDISLLWSPWMTFLSNVGANSTMLNCTFFNYLIPVFCFFFLNSWVTPWATTCCDLWMCDVYNIWQCCKFYCYDSVLHWMFVWGLYGWQRLPHGHWKRPMLSSSSVGRTEEQSGPGCEDIGVDRSIKSSSCCGCS